MTEITRRAMLAGTAALAAAPAFAAAPQSGQQAPGFYRYKVGDLELTQLSDGAATFPMPDHFVTNVSKETAIAEAAKAFGQMDDITVVKIVRVHAEDERERMRSTDERMRRTGETVYETA